MSDQETALEVNQALQEPPMFNVIYMNDDTTSMEFVINSLIQHFSYTENHAEETAVAVHEQGEVSVATLPFEIAEQKGTDVSREALKNGFPLSIRLEKDIY